MLKNVIFGTPLVLLLVFGFYFQGDVSSSPVQANFQEQISIGRGAILTAAWNPQGDVVAISSDQGIWLYDNTFADMGFLNAGVNEHIAWNADGTKLATGGSWDGSRHVQVWQVWDVASTTLDHEFARSSEGYPYLVTFSPDGKLLAAANHGTIQLWETQTNRELDPIHTGEGRQILQMVWNPDGDQIAISGPPFVEIWNIATGQLVIALDLSLSTAAYYNNLAWSADGTKIALAAWAQWSGTVDNLLHIFDAKSGAVLSVLQAEANADVAWSPVGDKLATSSGYYQANADYPLRIWDVQTGAIAVSLWEHKRPAYVEWHPDNQRLLSFSEDNSAHIWDTAADTAYDRRDQAVLKGHMGAVNALDWSPDDSELVSGSDDGGVRIWNIETGAQRLHLVGDTFASQAVAWSPDGQAIAGGGADIFVRIWRLDQTYSTGEPYLDAAAYSGHDLPLNRGEGNPNGVTSVAWSPEGELASSGLDGQVINWNLLNQIPNLLDNPNLFSPNRNYAVMSQNLWPVMSVDWMPDGRWLMGTGGTVQFWDASSGERVRNFLCNGEQGLVITAALSPDGERVAGVDAWGDKTCIWDVQSGELLAELPTTPIVLAWKPDEPILATIESKLDQEFLPSSVIQLWDVDAGEIVGTIEQPGANVITWNGTGSRLAIGCEDGTIHVWDVALP